MVWLQGRVSVCWREQFAFLYVFFFFLLCGWLIYLIVMLRHKLMIDFFHSSRPIWTFRRGAQKTILTRGSLAGLSFSCCTDSWDSTVAFVSSSTLTKHVMSGDWTYRSCNLTFFHVFFFCLSGCQDSFWPVKLPYTAKTEVKVLVFKEKKNN